MHTPSVSDCLPHDLAQALLIGRVWRHDGTHAGPSVVAVRGGEMYLPEMR